MVLLIFLIPLFFTNGSTCNDFHAWDTILDSMSVHGLNHCYIICNWTAGHWACPIDGPLKYDIDWNESFWRGFEAFNEKCNNLNILFTVHLFSQCMLESGRWEYNLWNVINGGPCVEGDSFLVVSEPQGPSPFWDWRMWNYYYQASFFNKILEVVSPCGTIISPIWEDEISIKDWFLWVRRKFFESFVIAHVPTKNTVEILGDIIEVENRGFGDEFLRFRKPVLNIGPYARNKVPEKRFIQECIKKGIHPSTNLNNDCLDWSPGYEIRIPLSFSSLCSP